MHRQTIDETEAVNALSAYLGKFSIHFLSAFARGSALPVVPKKNDKTSYLVNSFIGDAYERQAKTFEDVVVLVKGHMLANALICPDLEGLQGNFGGTRFFLDTPFVLRLLSVVGLPAYEAAAGAG